MTMFPVGCQVGTERGRLAAYTSDTAMRNNVHFVLQHLGLTV